MIARTPKNPQTLKSTVPKSTSLRNRETQGGQAKVKKRGPQGSPEPGEIGEGPQASSDALGLTDDLTRRYFPSRQPHEKCEHNAAEALKRAPRARYSAVNRTTSGVRVQLEAPLSSPRTVDRLHRPDHFLFHFFSTAFELPVSLPPQIRAGAEELRSSPWPVPRPDRPEDWFTRSTGLYVSRSG